MRQVRHDLEAEGQVEDAVVENSEVEIARPGDQPKRAIPEVKRAENQQEHPRRAGRQQRRDQGPEGGGRVERIVEDVEREDPEGQPVLVADAGDVIERCGGEISEVVAWRC